MNKEKINCAVEKYRELAYSAEEFLWAHPECGYKEWTSSNYLRDEFCKLGYTLTEAEDITGFYTTLDTGREGPTLLVLAELDSVICAGHPEADKTTGAVHSCGHHAQCAALLTVAAALKEEGVLDELSGKIKLCLVPAEELLEIGYRTELKKKGTIKYLGGKSEFLRRGFFDDVDLAFMVHTASAFRSLQGSVGCVAKTVIYKGRAAHAGGSPHAGINALYAATQGISAVNAIRETFKEADVIRFHPIITEGGQMVNAIPERAVIETYVRGLTTDAIVSNNVRINRALIGAALSLGANIEIIDQPGYAPLKNDPAMVAVAKEAYEALTGEEFVVSDTYSSGSTDMGDLSTFMPVVHPYAAGQSGTSHGADYKIADKEAALITCAKWQLTMISLLLGKSAERAKRIVADFKGVFASKEEFLAYQDSLDRSGDRIEYSDTGARIDL